MVEQALRAIVQMIIANAPKGWTHAVMHSWAGRDGASVTGGYTPGDPGGAALPSPFDELMAMAEDLREARGWEPVSMEIRCEPSGAFKLVAFDAALVQVPETGEGFLAVLDPAYRLPQPGERQEAGTAGPAGDPELAVARFRAYLDRRAAILGRRDELPPPATPAAIEDAERRLGHPLPADLRALYLIADGERTGSTSYLFAGSVWLSLDSLVAEHTGSVQRPWFGWDLEWNAVVFDTTPAETVRRCGGHPGWLRFASSGDGNFLAVDTVPAAHGRPGQVIRTGRDYDKGPGYVADSVTSLLGHYLELLDQGEYETDEDYLELFEPGGEHGTEEIVGDLPDEVPPTLQAIHINDAAGPVDLAPLTAAPGLRRLHLNRSTAAGLAPVRELPVESLHVTLADGDLTPLAGHPNLSSLDLTCAAPTDLTPLRTVAQLRGLDLSGTDVADLTALAELPDLRYLALTGRQWAALLDEGKAPPTLAAARLAEADAGLDDALAWADRLGMDTGDAFRLTGSVRGAGR